MAATRRISYLSPRLLGSTALVTLGVAVSSAARAEVSTDGTLGPRVTLAGPNIGIGAELGQTRGGNLFHSFQRFDVDTGGRVTFTGPGGIRNVIGRVTGGQRSSIDGTLASDIQGANLYLLNPAGILFGPNARLDVKGSFHASTADQLNFADGAVFSALDTAGSTLTVAEPQSFGFLGGNAGRIDVSGSRLLVRSGTTLGLSAGEVAIAGATLGNDEISPPALNTAVSLAAQQGAGEVSIDATQPAVARDGAVSLGPDGAGNPSTVTIRGPGGGRIRIEGGQVLVVGSNVESENTGDIADTSGVDIAAASFTLESGRVRTFTRNSGTAGDVSVRTSTLQLRDQGQIASSTYSSGGGGNLSVEVDQLDADGATTLPGSRLTGLVAGTASYSSGDAGTITVAAGNVILSNGAQISGITRGAGRGGAVAIEAGSIAVDGGFRAGYSSFPSAILATAERGSTGSAGNITVGARSIELTGGGQILVSTFGQGDGGSVAIDTDTLRVDGRFLDQGFFFPSGVLATAEGGSEGNAGAIRIAADLVELTDRGQITTNTRGLGDGGAIEIVAGTLIADAASDGPAVLGTGLLADTAGPGAAGSITVDADAIELRNGGKISSSTSGSGAGGAISVSASSVAVTGGFSAGSSSFASTIRATADPGGTGSAGSIAIDAGTITITGGGTIFAGTLGLGNGGSVSIDADTLSVTGNFVGPGSSFPSAVVAGADVGSQGNAGTVRVNAGRIEVAGEGRISGNARGTGNGGGVQITAEDIVLTGGGQITSSTFGPGAAGPVVVGARDLTISGNGAANFTGIASSALRGSTGAAGSASVTADRISIARQGAADRAGVVSDTFGPKPAGVVTVVANERLEVRDGGVVSSSTFADGAAGTVTVSAGALLIDADGFDQFATGILSQAELGSSGAAGVVTIVADDLQVRGGGGIASSTFGLGAAGTVLVAADNLLVSSDGFRRFITGISSQSNPGSSGAAGLVAVLVTGGQAEVRGELAQITSKSLGSGNAGGVGVSAPRVLVRDGGSITSESPNAQAGVALVLADEVTVEDATIRTSSGGFAGGQIRVDADDRIYLRDAEVTTNGVIPSANTSLITLQAREIILNRSQVTSLTERGVLAGSGEAILLGDVTVISADSLVAGSSSVVISGLQTNLGSDLQLPSTVFLDASRLLRDSCAATGAGPRSSFTRGGRGGLPPAPDRPLPSAGAEGSAPAPADIGWRLPMTLTACDPDAPAEPAT